MGTDMYGWVEVKRSETSTSWDGVIKTDWLLGRDYDMYARLFGVRRLDAKAVAADKGLPKGYSDEVKQDFGVREGGHGQGITADIRFLSWIGLDEIWKHKDYLIENAPDDWVLLFEMMTMLGKHFGGFNVRLVVGFD